MIIIVDSREHEGKNQHILDWFDSNGIEYIRKVTLPTGDYMAHGNKTVTIDRKQSLQEVYQNLFCDGARFRDECIRARRDKMRLVVLVEESFIRSLDDVRSWINPRLKKWCEDEQRLKLGKRIYGNHQKIAPFSSEELCGRMAMMKRNYGVDWRFCDKPESGKVIVDILGGEE